MRTFDIPYDRGTLPLHVEEKNLKAVLQANIRRHSAKYSQREIVLNALQNPIGTPRLSELSKGKKKIVLVTSDHTRAMPSKVTLPIILEEIRLGNPDADISILIATGLHRATTEAEQRSMFGDAIVDNEHILVNDAFCPEQFSQIGMLPSGTVFSANRIAAECDLLITEGFIEPHFFAGFSGGRKSILPGICDEPTVKANHSYKAVASPYAMAGILENNPIHQDMITAARMLDVAFIFNVALDEKKNIIAAWAGDLEEAHSQGVSFVRSLSQCKAVTGDIVITSNGGYPLDQNLYQTPKAAATAEVCAGEDGVIIICAACRDGFGGDFFQKTICMGIPEEIDRYLSGFMPMETIPETWCAQVYARILKKHSVILVSTFLNPETVRKANMIPACNLDEALTIAYGMMGEDAKVVVIPDGVSVMAVKEKAEVK